MITLSSWLLERSNARRTLQAEFNLAASYRALALKRLIEDKLLILESIQSMFAAVEGVPQPEFGLFIEPLQARNDGVQALDWVAHVRHVDREAFEAARRRQGIKDFEIRERKAQGVMVRAAQRAEYFPVFSLDPEESDEDSVGFDLASNEDRAAAISKARDSGEAVATGRVTLVQEAQGSYGFLILYPVYSQNVPQVTVEQRREHFKGFVLGVFRIPDIVAQALLVFEPEGIDLRGIDESANPEEQLLFFHSSRTLDQAQVGLQESVANQVISYTVGFQVGGRQWRIECMAAPYFIASRASFTPYGILAGGFGFTGLLAAFFAAGIRRERETKQATEKLAETNQGLQDEISQREEAERIAQEGEARHRAISEQLSEAQSVAKVGSWERNIETNQLIWSDELYRICGVRREEFSAYFEGFLALIIPDDRERVKMAIEDVIEQNSSYSNEYRIRRPDGEIRHLHSIGHFKLDELGKPVRMYGIVQDITDRKNEEMARRKTEARYASILDGSADAIISVDRNERVIVFNKGAEKAFGYREKEIIGQPLEILIPKHSHKAHKRAFTEFLDAPNSSLLMESRAEIRGLRKNGDEFPAEASLTKQNVEGELVLTAVLRDITERKHIAQQLMQAQKVEAIGLLASGVAHDFNNNLAAIMINSELAADCLESDHPDIQQGQENLKQISHIAKVAAGVARQLLTFSRKEVVERRIIRLESVLSEITEMLKRLIREDIHLEVSVGSDLASIKAAESQIEQIIVNLAVNGRDAMPRGGLLRIKVENVEVEKPITEAKVTPGKYVRVLVEDTGIGMNKETIESIFNPFFTTKPLGRGTGLGLATVHRTVSEMDSVIGVSSIPGKGTRFMIYIPAVDPEPEEIQSKQPPRSQSRSKGETILYCEDEKSIREITKQLLMTKGYTILAAVDGASALEIAKSHQGDIHLLITDVIMPGISGVELSGQTTKLFPSIKVLFVSGYTADLLKDHGITHGPKSFLAKPFNTRQLLQRIHDLLDADEQDSADG